MISWSRRQMTSLVILGHGFRYMGFRCSKSDANPENVLLGIQRTNKYFFDCC